MKNIAVLGATGSIGRNTLEVITQLGKEYQVHSLAARSQLELLAEQVRYFQPHLVAVADPASEPEIRDLLGANSVELLSGEEALVELAEDPQVDVVVNALVGSIGLKATLAALEAGKVVALANKESIVMAGHLVMRAVATGEGLLVPIDSEHSAILQCLRGENPGQVKRLILTASGGPFLRKAFDEFAAVTPEDALKHPNWKMGPKITVDCSTLMNKGLEVIEAHYLFSLPPDRIQVVIHPQSVVHSLVEFVDGSLKAQLSAPDMRIPIQYALTYPERQTADFVTTDLIEIGSLDFEAPDPERFPCLNLAYKSLEMGDGYPTVLNAANEIAVEAFLSKKLVFNQISALIEEALSAFHPPPSLDLDNVLMVDRWARDWCQSRIDKLTVNGTAGR